MCNMSLNNLVSKYSAEEAQSMHEKDSDNDELDEEKMHARKLSV